MTDTPYARSIVADVSACSGGPSAITPPSPEHDDAVGEGGGFFELMQHGDDERAARSQFAHELQRLDGRLEIEVRRRLVEQDDGRALRDRERDPHALPLAGRQRADLAAAKRRQARARERVVDRGFVLRRGVPLPPAMVREARRGDGVLDEQGRKDRLRRIDERDTARALTRIERAHVDTVERDRAAHGRERTSHRAQQRRLANAVGADHRDDAAVERERDVTQQRPAAACHLDPLEDERHRIRLGAAR